jgi:hypothetical protein
LFGVITAHHALTEWLGLALEDFYLFAAMGSLLFMLPTTDETRPTCRRHWAILAVTAVMAGVAGTLAAMGTTWFLTWIEPDLRGGGIALIVAIGVCGLAVLLILWIADRLTRADNLIFPRDAEESEGGAG